MKRFILFMFLLPLLAFSQVNDDFSSVYFKNGPTIWSDTTNFKITSGELNSNGPNIAGQIIYLSTAINLVDTTEWKFLVDLRFPPSSLNYVRVYLDADVSDLTTTGNAYYVQIGQTNADSIKLYKMISGNPTLLFTGSSSFPGNVLVRIKITRDPTGVWNIYADNTGGLSFNSEGPSFTDNSITSNGYFGVYCNYGSASRYNMYYFDDFYVGHIVPDSVIPPTAPPLSNDVVINESLSHPLTNGAKYIELYNRSDKVIDLKNLELAEFDTTAIKVIKTYVITSHSYILNPGDYVLLTTDTANVRQNYLTSNQHVFVQIASTPSGYNDDDGSVALVSAIDSSFIDKFIYSSGMYYPLLTSFAGVAFERICYDRRSSDKTNWHSAAEDVGFGTPGLRNSQFSCTTEVIPDPVSVSPEIFSPDNDGKDDVLNINYKFDVPGYMGTIVIYDASGRLIRNLIKNELLGASGSFSWDGITNDKDKARIGIYVIYVEVLDLNGKTKHYKKTAVLASRL